MPQHPPRNFDELAERVLARKGVLRLTGLRGAARAWAGAALVHAVAPKPVLFLAPDAKSADALLEDLRVMLGEPAAEEGGSVRPFPHPDTLPYDRFSPQPFVTAQRMDVLYRWLDLGRERNTEAKPLVVVAPLAALALRVPTRAALRARTTQLHVGQQIDRDELVAALVAAGYARMALVE